MNNRLIVSLALIVCFCACADGQSWVAMPGVTGEIKALATDSTNVYAGGSFTSSGGAQYVAMTNGNKWMKLDGGLDGPVYALACFNHLLYAGGNFFHALSDNSDMPYVAVWGGHAWGPLETILNGPVYCFAVYHNKLYVGGSFNLGTYHRGVVVWDGVSFGNLETGTDGPIYAMTVYHDQLIVGGEFTEAGSIEANHLAAWNDTTWHTIGLEDASGANGTVRALGVFHNQLVVGGDFSIIDNIYANNIAAWNDTAWSALGGGSDGPVMTLDVYHDRLFAGGTFTTMTGLRVNKTAQWNDTLWFPMGAGVAGSRVSALTVCGDNLYLAGLFSNVSGLPCGNIVQWSINAQSSTLALSSMWDKDGSLETQGDRRDYPWRLEIYKDSLDSSHLFAAADTNLISAFIASEGTYYAVEADSAGWHRINRPSLIDTFTIPLGITLSDTFVNSRPLIHVPFTVAAGWALVANPISDWNYSWNSIFPPGGNEPFKYVPGTGYARTTLTAPGLGVWMKYAGAVDSAFMGFPIDYLEVPVLHGWNMIGGFTDTILVSDIVQNPGSNLWSAFYDYRTGYHQSDSILPGRGYWIKVHQDGALIFSAAGKKGAPKIPAASDLLADAIVLRITDAAGSTQQLAIAGTIPAGGVMDGFELPPAPPEGMFDVRFHSGGWCIGSDAGAAMPIDLTGVRYPLTISWEGRSQSRRAINPPVLRGSGIGEHALTGNGSVIVADEQSLAVVLNGAAPHKPDRFALLQNYPNPFNPITTIAFDVPGPAIVDVAVYDLLGREVNHVVDAKVYAGGSVSAPFDAGALGSGVYYYRMIARSLDGSSELFRDVRRMMVVK